MTENGKTTKKEFVDHGPVVEVGEFDVVSKITQDMPAGERACVVGEVYVVDGKVDWGMMEERWGLNEIAFAQSAVNTLLTRVNFKGLGDVNKMQDAVNKYKAGQRQTGGAKVGPMEKALAKEFAKSDKVKKMSAEEQKAAITAFVENARKAGII